MKLLSTILIVTLLITGAGCKQKSPLPVEEYITKLRATLKEDPDAAREMAIKLEEIYDQMPDREKAAYAILYFETYEKSFTPFPYRNYLDFSIEYFNSINHLPPLQYCHLYKAWMLREYNKYDEAIKELLLAREHVDTIKCPGICSVIHMQLGMMATDQKEFDKAIEYLEQSIPFSIKANIPLNETNTHMMIGRIHTERKEYDKARKSIQQALAIAPDSISIGELLKDMGCVYYESAHPDSALWYIGQSHLYPSYGGEIGIRQYHMALVHSQIGNTDSAIHYAKKALEGEITIQGSRDCYELLTDLAVKEGNKEEIAYYLKKQRECEDSIKRATAQPNIHLIEQLHTNNKETEKIRARQMRVYIFTGLVACIAIGISALFYRFRKKEQSKANTYRNKLERKELELHIKEVNTEIEKTRARNAAARRIAKPEEKEEIDKNTYTEALRLDAPDIFLKKMNQSLGGLPDRLKAEYPNISQKELIWCCLYLLNIHTTDISLLMDFKISTQYKFKQRLAKKLNFQSTKELEQMLYEKADQGYQQTNITDK